MKVLRCSDLGVNDSFQATGYSDEEVINKMFIHFRKRHPEIYDKLDPNENYNMREKMKKILKHQKA
jgi:predicted small metal-binding protein